MKLLIEAGADVNMADTDGKTALMKAATIGNWECVELLIKTVADVNITDRSGETALMKAATIGSLECAELLMEAGADVNITDRSGETALMKAATIGSLECVKLLIEAGADVNITDRSGETALMKAATIGSLECVELLIKTGADVKITDRSGETSPMLYEYFITPGADSIEKITFVYWLCDLRRETALTMAVRNGNWKCVELLIKAGASVNIDHDWKLMVNVQNIEQELDKLDFLTGNDVMIKCHILVQACRGRCHPFVDALIKSGVGVNMVDFLSGDTPLMATARSRSADCMKFVLRGGAAVNTTNHPEKGTLEVLITTSETNNCILLLVVAGEMISQSTYNELRNSLLPDDYTEDSREPFEALKLQLKHTCREAIRKYEKYEIRKHLLERDPHSNLFYNIRRLPLPSALTSYLLFDVSLEPEDDNLNNMDNETAMAMMMTLKSMQVKDDEKKTVKE